MSKLLIILLLFFPLQHAFSQGDEQLRAEAFQARQKGDLDIAVEKYQRILEMNPGDYDAKLALARTLHSLGQYERSNQIFEEIYLNDRTDVEAIMGLGGNYLYMGEMRKAELFFKRAKGRLPNYLPAQLQLAKTYSWDGKLGKAISVYREILYLDKTNAQAIFGIAQMYDWMGKPRKAVPYYEKALSLEPENRMFQQHYRDTRLSLRPSFLAGVRYFTEEESSYKIGSVIQQYGLTKRVGNHFTMSFNGLLNKAERNVLTGFATDTSRWYNDFGAKLGFLFGRQKVFAFASYSSSDQRFSAYGLNWQYRQKWGRVQLETSLLGQYEYFFFWNEIGHHKAAANLSLRFGRFSASFGGGYALTDRAALSDIENDRYFDGTNPSLNYASSLTFDLLQSPLLSIGTVYSYFDYRYKSRFYYTPYDRSLFGPRISFQHNIGRVSLFARYEMKFGQEYYFDQLSNGDILQVGLNADSHYYRASCSYNWDQLSISIHGSRFKNDFYANYQLGLRLRGTF